MEKFYLLLVIAVLVAEAYKAKFEKSGESKDERGQLILLRVKSMSYNYLTVGVAGGFLLVGLFKVMTIKFFPFFILIVFLFQSVVSAVYLGIVRRKVV
ncbi:MAG TPA: hypothetical protein VIG73_02215 [Cerasibacillus sp.]|uniref:hypothetical protein n=1 Tax=Cerasibacillus sp. TaxID=2498711 RepID=UPI002F40F6FD